MENRKNTLCFNVKAELAIYNAMQEVETLEADTRLTDAVILLAKAKDLVSEYVDEKIGAPKPPKP